MKRSKTVSRKVFLRIGLPFIIFAIIALRLFVGEVCAVPSASMSPTIIVGDRLWIDKTSYGARLPRRFVDIPLLNVFTWIKPLRLADEKNDWGFNRLSCIRTPHLGDLAVFESPEFPCPLLVKRIAVKYNSGDTIVINSENYNIMHTIVLNEGHEINLRNDSIQPDVRIYSKFFSSGMNKYGYFFNKSG